ncbi:DMT family transporter [soil metagenome]
MTRTDARAHLVAVWVALFVTVLWSSSWILIRVGLDDESLPPITFAALRYTLAAVVLVGWTSRKTNHRRAVRQLSRGDLIRLAVLGVVFYAVNQAAVFVAIDNQPAATNILVLSLTPLLVAGAGARSLGERAAIRQVAGAALVALGAWRYFSGDLGATAVGMIAALTALVANTFSSVFGRHVNRGHAIPAVVVTTVSMTIGAALLLVTALTIDGWPSVSGRAALIIGWLAVVNTALAFTLWNLSLRRLTALESAGINNTMLIQIAVLAWIFLDEQPGVMGAFGVLVVSFGVFLTQLARRPDPVVLESP